MKKLIVLLTVAMLISLSLSGCSGPSPSQTVIKDVPDEIKDASQGATTEAPSEGHSEVPSEYVEVQPIEKAPSSLIAKSENAVTEADRLELLNALDQELDTLIQLLDDLESIEDSDLDLSGFE